MHLNTKVVSLATILSIFLVCSQINSTLGMELSRTFQDYQNPDKDMDTDRIDVSDSEAGEVQRRTCNGFPCMYSHLGTKAGKASLYKTLASFIDECFSDPFCDPGRRKRQSPTRKIQKLMETPLYKIVEWRMRNGD